MIVHDQCVFCGLWLPVLGKSRGDSSLRVRAIDNSHQICRGIGQCGISTLTVCMYELAGCRAVAKARFLDPFKDELELGDDTEEFREEMRIAFGRSSAQDAHSHVLHPLMLAAGITPEQQGPSGVDASPANLRFAKSLTIAAQSKWQRASSMFALS